MSPQPPNLAVLEQAVTAVHKLLPGAAPRVALVLGSGWGEAISSFTIHRSVPFSEIPGYGATGVVGHAGVLHWAELNGIQSLVFQGRRHLFEGVDFTPLALPVFISHALGANTLFATNAAGGIRSDLSPGDLVSISDHISFFLPNALRGDSMSIWDSPRFVDMSNVYDRSLREALKRAGQSVGVQIKEGVYLPLPGSTYETPAEIRALASLGADLVGMSTVPEVVMARAAGMRVIGLSCVSNKAAGLSAHALSHDEVTETLARSMSKIGALFTAFWQQPELSAKA